MNIIPFETPCLRCVFGAMPQMGTFPTCDTAGVIGPIAGIIGSIQATEAIKILAGKYESANKTLIEIDVWDTKVKQIDVSDLRSLNDCPTCKLHTYKFLKAEDGVMTTLLCGKNSVQVMCRNISNIDLGQLAKRLASISDLNAASDAVRFPEIAVKISEKSTAAPTIEDSSIRRSELPKDVP